ncbi:uncharacterized protein N7496_012654 [Penicillium cataractarum]|uniref:Uncharacterized protein n=1 Tax=Penicillium cataractarum TaxID=2100454 RepID=A0A9W9R815_9EURO|nr:uncharacterized protein N7496_012654 [Penicillium cataractarum]KAJ5355442.1 hypothetical protein N7496_012654 [Penicillium cataractarum]
MNVDLNPNVTSSNSLMGITPPPLLFHPIAFPSNVNGYQGSSVTAEHIRSSAHPSQGNPSQASAFENTLENGFPSGLPRGHVCPANQAHRESQEVQLSNETDPLYKCGWTREEHSHLSGLVQVPSLREKV